MPALPTTNLTAHFDASNSDDVLDGAGGSPVGDGAVAVVWDDENDGIADLLLLENGSGVGATYRVNVPLMNHACLDFDGTDDNYAARTDDTLTTHPISDFITVSEFTVIVAFWAESITNTSSDGFARQSLMGTNNAFWALAVYDNAGTKKLAGFNEDGTSSTIEATVTTGANWVGVYQHVGGNLKLTVIANDGTATNAVDVPSGDTQVVTGVLKVGSGHTGSAQFYNGRIGEFAIYNAGLSGANLTNAKQYFIDKWLNVAAPAAAAVTGKIWSPTLISHPALLS